MPKTHLTPRDELVCGKLDALCDLVIDMQIAKSLDMIRDIRGDCQRMEGGLIRRKDEVADLQSQLKNSTPNADIQALINSCIELKKDLIMRGTKDSEGFVVVDVSCGRWLTFNEALSLINKEPDNA